LNNQFTDKKKRFYNNLKPDRLKIKHIISCLLLVIFVGLLWDGTSGFPILRESSGVLTAIGSLFVLGILYICGEGLGEWVGSKDKTSQPLLRRIFNLFLLLLFIVLFSFVAYKILMFFNIKI
jgi:hypothetical protein